VNIKSVFFTLFFCLMCNLGTKAQSLENCIKIKDSGFVAMDKRNYPVALEYLTKAQLLAEKGNYYLQIFEIKNNIGIIYFNLSDYGEALNYYLAAYTIAIKHLDENKEMIVLNNIAVIYSVDNNFEKAKEFYGKAYDLAKQSNDKGKIGLYAINLAKVANSLKQFNTANKYLAEAFKYLKKEDPLFLQLEATRAENLLLHRESEEAKRILFAIYSKTKAKKVENKEINSTVLSLLARAYSLDKDYDRSIFYLNVCLKETSDFETRADLFSSLSDAYTKKKQFELALNAMKMMVASRDSLSKVNSDNLYESNKVKFDVQNYKNDLNKSLEKSKLEREIFFTALLVFSLLLFLIFRMFRNRTIKLKQKKIISDSKQKITILELENEKGEKLLLEKQVQEIENKSLLELERLKREIEQKNRKLSAKALYLSGRNEMIEEIINSLSKVPDISQNLSLKKHIGTLKEHLKSDSEWDNFIVHFEEVNHGLLNSLKEKHPSLTSNDIRFLCYVYMNLSSKEMCTIFNITQEAFRKRKERIFNKMNIDKSMSFYDYLSAM
jgi:tetratricopeptide (TPR) repeat protein